MQTLDKEKFIVKADKLAGEGKAFLFIINFDFSKTFIIEKEDIDPEYVLVHLPGFSNSDHAKHEGRNIEIKSFPVDFHTYKEVFDQAQKEFVYGNTYLLNLCFETKIELNTGLIEIFNSSKAPYKLYLKDQFVLFSPERFVRIENGRIFTNPMKGTLVKKDENSAQQLLDDFKEGAEHATITDLLRNDLSKVAYGVSVDRYRYIDEIKTGDEILLQASSQISGTLLPEFENRPGSLFAEILPAGSISGAPKQKTVEIIHRLENFNRDFYTGVFGYFDGKNLDSAVMIRFIQKTGDDYVYKSGGGITSMSEAEKEYNELKQKIYVPVH